MERKFFSKNRNSLKIYCILLTTALMVLLSKMIAIHFLSLFGSNSSNFFGVILDSAFLTVLVLPIVYIACFRNFSASIYKQILKNKYLKENCQELVERVNKRSLDLKDKNKRLILEIEKRKENEKQIEKQIRHLNALRKIDIAITSNFDLGPTLNTLIDELMSNLKVDSASVLLFNQYNDTLEYAKGKGFRTNRIKNVQLKIGESYAGYVAKTQKKLLIPNLEKFDNTAIKLSGYNFSKSWLIKEEGFKSYIAEPLITKGKLKGVLEVFHRTPKELDSEWVYFLEALAGQAAIAIENANLFKDLESSYSEIASAYDSTIAGWSRALEYRDHETNGHSQRVTNLTLKIADKIGISKLDTGQIKWGALLHDIGKLGVPDHILLKPGKLSSHEWETMIKHPEIALEILSPIKFLQNSLDIPYCHHEKWDGSGYPRGLKGDNIPLSARIFAIADVYDALNSDRPYRPAWSHEKITDYIFQASGKHFDPEVVEVFKELNGHDSRLN